MFTGIIQKVGQVSEALESDHELRLCVGSSFSDLSLGESVAINGVCLTTTEFSTEGRLFFHVSSETLARTNLGALRSGSPVNLERALLPGDRLSGHIVQGHVDGLARLIRAEASGASHEVVFELPESLARYCVEKGSIALNGVSLTINRVAGGELGIMLIPHTWQNTNLSSLRPGDAVNVEIDVFAKYVEKLCQPYKTP